MKKLHGAASEDRLWLFLMRLRHIQRRHAMNVFALDTENLPARCKDGDLRTETHDRFDQPRDRFDDVFTVVKDQKKSSVSDSPSNRFGRDLAARQLQAEDACDRRGH
jgi:hypothetical protein